MGSTRSIHAVQRYPSSENHILLSSGIAVWELFNQLPNLVNQTVPDMSVESTVARSSILHLSKTLVVFVQCRVYDNNSAFYTYQPGTPSDNELFDLRSVKRMSVDPVLFGLGLRYELMIRTDILLSPPTRCFSHGAHIAQFIWS